MVIILLKNPSNDKVCAVMGGDDIATFDSESEAESWIDESPIAKAWPFQIVELEWK